MKAVWTLRADASVLTSQLLLVLSRINAVALCPLHLFSDIHDHRPEVCFRLITMVLYLGLYLNLGRLRWKGTLSYGIVIFQFILGKGEAKTAGSEKEGRG